MRDRYPWSRTGNDFIPAFDAFLLEVRSGIMRSMDDLRSRTLEPMAWLRREARKRGLRLLTLGCHPAVGAAACVHVHCGSEHSFSRATALANEMARSVPAFAALMANSPFWGPMRDEFKSYRVLRKADYCSRPRAFQSPETALMNWGEDVCVKVDVKPTVEVRLADGASSARIVAEYVTLLLGWTASLSENPMEPLDPGGFRESLMNRFRAAKHGLQAVFDVSGKEVPVSEILEGMVDRSKPGLSRIGASVSDLPILRRMIEKRQTQADLWSHLGKRYPDPLVLAVEAAALTENEDLFETYLEAAPALDPVLGPNLKDALYERIGRHTSYTTLSERFSVPHSDLEKALSELIQEGKITEKRSLDESPRYSRRRGRRPRRSP
jgi:hypothetical protein